MAGVAMEKSSRELVRMRHRRALRNAARQRDRVLQGKDARKTRRHAERERVSAFAAVPGCQCFVGGGTHSAGSDVAPWRHSDLVRFASDVSAGPNYAVNRLRGRPPLAPLAFAAVAFAFDRRRPPWRPVDAARRRLPNARSTSPGT